MKSVLIFLTTIILVALIQWWLPWYCLAVPTFFVGFLYHQKKASVAFLIGFLAVFLLWFGMIFLINQDNNSILANRLSILFFKHQWVFLLMLVNSLIGGLVAGLSMLSGFYLRKAL
ncbi:MAG: hypothetical protein RL065_541 [Bacteroidota bacterium]|jgi:hypothetical protein